MSKLQDLRDKIDAREARIGVIGLGYVGLPLAVELGGAGFSVVGFDVDASKVRTLGEGRSYIGDVPSEDLRAQIDAGRFEATADFTKLAARAAGDMVFPIEIRLDVAGNRPRITFT